MSAFTSVVFPLPRSPATAHVVEVIVFERLARVARRRVSSRATQCVTMRRCSDFSRIVPRREIDWIGTTTTRVRG